LSREDKIKHSLIFREWASTLIGPDGLAMNPNSATQIGTFLFGGSTNQKTGEPTEDVRVFKTLREEVCEEALLAYAERDEMERSGPYPEDDAVELEPDEFDLMTAVQLKEVSERSDDLKKNRQHGCSSRTNVLLDFTRFARSILSRQICKETGLKMSGKKDVLQQRLRDHFLAGGEKAASIMSDMTVAELRDACVARGLKKTGSKTELVNRLEEDEKYVAWRGAKRRAVRTPAEATTRHIRIARLAIRWLLCRVAQRCAVRVEVKRAIFVLVANSLRHQQQVR